MYDREEPVSGVSVTGGSVCKTNTSHRGMCVENDKREIIGITCASTTDSVENNVTDINDSTRSFKLTKPITVDLTCLNSPFHKKQKRRLKTRKFEW